MREEDIKKLFGIKSPARSFTGVDKSDMYDALIRGFEEGTKLFHNHTGKEEIKMDYQKYHAPHIAIVDSYGRARYLHDDMSDNYYFRIKKVVFNAPATIVFWMDGTKTVVKCGENDIYDPEKGLAMAITKRALGDSGSYYNVFKRWLPEKEELTWGDYIFNKIFPKKDTDKKEDSDGRTKC